MSAAAVFTPVRSSQHQQEATTVRSLGSAIQTAQKQPGLFINTNLNFMKTSSQLAVCAGASSSLGSFFGQPSTTRIHEALSALSSSQQKLGAFSADQAAVLHNSSATSVDFKNEFNFMCIGTREPVFAQINARLDRGFFVNENQEWTSYRRNYFKVSVGFTLHQNPDGPAIAMDANTDVTLSRNGQHFKSFQVGLVGRLADCDKCVELIQHTPKRDKNAINIVRPMTVAPGGNPAISASASGTPATASNGLQGSMSPPASGTTFAPTVVTFDRVQFKKATANNGKRKAAQQFYTLEVELYGITELDERVLISTIASAPLVIRGRSPGHYSSKALQIQIGGPLSAGPSSAASTSVPESPWSQIYSSNNSLLSPQRATPIENGFSSFNLSCTNNSPFHQVSSSAPYSNSFTSPTVSKFNSNQSSPINSSPQTFSAGNSRHAVNNSGGFTVETNWIQQPTSFCQQQQQQLSSSPSSGFQLNFNGQQHVPFHQMQQSHKMLQQDLGNGFLHQPLQQSIDIPFEKNMVLTSPFPSSTPTTVPLGGFFPENGNFYHAMAQKHLQQQQQQQQQFLESSPPPSSNSVFGSFYEDQFAQQLGITIEELAQDLSRS